MSANERVIVVAAAESLDSTAVREKLHLDGCGSIVSFLGITRGVDDGVEIKRLEFDAWEEKLPQVLSNLGHEALSKFGVSSVSMAHRTGSVGPSEPIVAIHVASPHRAEGFEACSWLIDELKSQAPLWKKEVRADGTIWKGGLG
nr:molybdenum cofactor biosynthesis protein MoaE [Euryarchaeota archaeon]